MATYQTSIKHKQMDGEYRGDLMVQIPVLWEKLCCDAQCFNAVNKVKHNQKYVPNMWV